MTFGPRALFGALMIAALPAPLLAHQLVASTPATGATVSGLKTLTFTFAEPLDTKASGAALTMTAMPGMTDHPPMKMTAMKPGFADEGKTITLSAKAPLAAGSYKADWWATSKGGHRLTGQIAFTVQ